MFETYTSYIITLYVGLQENICETIGTRDIKYGKMIYFYINRHFTWNVAEKEYFTQNKNVINSALKVTKNSIKSL